MHLKNFFAFVFLSCSIAALHAQKFDLGDVTKAELLEKSHPTDTSAAAAIFFKKAKTTFKYTIENGFVVNTEFSIKIKIYKKEGLGWANFEIPYYTGYEELGDDYINVSKAFTYNLEDGKIKKDKITNESKYIQTFNEYWKIKSIAFSNVKVGSIIELKYNFISQDISAFPDFQYQYDIPVNYAEYATEIPVFFSYKTIKNGFVDVEMKEKVENVTQSYREKVDLNFQEKTLQYSQISTIYKAKNVPAMITENYVNNMHNYYGKLENELQTIQYPGQKPKQMADTWQNVAQTIFENKHFGAELEKYDYFLQDLKRVIIDTSIPDEQKLQDVFYFIRNRMAWNGKYGYYTKKGVELAYSEKSGNAAEINLILIAALKLAGLDANPVLISTRDNGVAKFPNRSKFNFVIAGVKTGNKTILLDATSKKSHPGIIPIRDLNWRGRLIEKDGKSSEVDLMPKIISKNTVNVLATINTDASVEGKLKEQYFDSDGIEFSENYSNLANESHKERLEIKYKGVEIEAYDFKDKTQIDAPVIESYSFRDTNSIEIIGDKMYFSPMLFLALDQNPFRQERRQYEIDFGFAQEDKYLISITIPDGYSVEIVPKSVMIPLPDDLGSMNYMISHTDNKIQLSVTLAINTAIFPSDYYDVLKAFFSEVVKKQTEKIVLKKI